jgi:hypothetical protein
MAQSQKGVHMQKNNQHTLRYRGKSNQPLTLIAPNDPSFDAEMAVLFPAYTWRPNYQASRPFLVILRNDTRRTARAYEVVWHVQGLDPTASGVPAELRLTAFAITTPLEMRTPGGIRGTDRSIHPGEARLLSPFFNGARTDSADFAIFNRPGQLPDPSTYVAILAELDCVVYGDGSFAGPNRNHLLLRYLVARDAQHDEALAVLRRLRSIPRDPQLKGLLDLRRRIGSANTQPSMRAVPTYIHARSTAAQEFEEILERDGYERLQATAEELVSLMPPHEKFTALGGHYHRAKFHLNGTLVSPMD